MLLYEKFGLDSKLFNKKNFIDDLEMLQTYLKKSPPHKDLISTYKRSLVTDSNRICINYYLIGKKDQTEKYAKPIFDYALEYFFGEWRATTPYDGKTGFNVWKKSLWLEEYRAAILWASILGEWDKAKEISRYPDELCMKADFETREKKAWYVLLAKYLSEESLENVSSYIKTIESGKKKREKLLINILRTIVTSDTEAFTKEFCVYMKYYKAREFSQKQICEKLAIDGTTLFNLAIHKKMKVKFPEDYIDFYIHL